MKTAELRALVEEKSAYAQREFLPFSLCSSPLPRGALIEVTGFGKCEFVARFLAENPKFQAIWLENELTVNPFALLQRRVAMEKLFFVEAREDLFWAATQILNSSLYDVVVVGSPRWGLKQLRQLQLRAQKSNSFVFFLNKRSQSAWPISLSLHIDHAFLEGKINAQIVKRRLGYS